MTQKKKKNLHKNVHRAPAYWSKCVLEHIVYLLLSIWWDVYLWPRLESLLLYHFFGFYYNTHFFCAPTSQILLRADTCIDFVFLSPSNFLSPGILPSSLDGKKFMWSSKLLLFALCLCVTVCYLFFFPFLCLLKAWNCVSSPRHSLDDL